MAAEASQLILGPILRYAGTETATVWVETDGPAEVEILGHTARTFHVEGHHYALVQIERLEPGSVTQYEVRLSGTVAWPPADGRPPCFIRTRHDEREAELVFGSCRVGAPEHPPYTLLPGEHPQGVGVDALWAYARELQADPTTWPDALILLGDQVYADDVSPETAAFIRERRDTSQAPGAEVANFEEYTRLYREAWSDPDIRWLLSTVPSTMIFDDHDVHDDWNISQSWVDEMRRLPWWDERVTGAFMAYWLYQHLGNLSPPEIAEEELFRQLQGDADGGPRLRAFAKRCDRESAASRWAYYRDFGHTRLLVIDSRAARVLADGQRAMVDAEEWEWILAHSRGTFDHLIIASTLPVFMAHGIHNLEAWNEAVCSGAWGAMPARLGERLRRTVDLEHWPAFHDSFTAIVELLRGASRGLDGGPPATIILLGGDVHTAYIARVILGGDAGPARVFQIVCSPFRNPLSPAARRVVRLTGSELAARVFAKLARLAGVNLPTIRWKFVHGPTYNNSIGSLTLTGRAASVTISRSTQASEGPPLLRPLHVCELATDPETRVTKTPSEPCRTQTVTAPPLLDAGDTATVPLKP